MILIFFSSLCESSRAFAMASQAHHEAHRQTPADLLLWVQKEALALLSRDLVRKWAKPLCRLHK